MRRALASALVAVLLASCGAAERPEGIVERWLLALNQGQAGEPERYAFNGVSQAAVRNWGTADPGAFDVIEVGRAQPCRDVGPIVCEAMVPFRVVLVDGSEIHRAALVGINRMGNDKDPDPSRVFGVSRADVGAMLPSRGGPPIGSAQTSAWFVALAVAVCLIVLGEAAMRLARGRRG